MLEESEYEVDRLGLPRGCGRNAWNAGVALALTVLSCRLVYRHLARTRLPVLTRIHQNLRQLLRSRHSKAERTVDATARAPHSLLSV